ncbi:MAG: CDP-diacylglycerol--serine O-phosphatidyltransferase [Candidatus Nitrospinota bacterium M3_3B_026]
MSDHEQSGAEEDLHPREEDRGRLEKFQNIRKGIFIVPSLLTSAAFFCGFYSIIASINGDFYRAAWAVIVAMFFDGIDGRVARATGSATAFGVEYDSLSDLVAFGVAPAILMYNWVLQPFGKVGWMAGFLFVICGALRLARFNTQSSEVRKNRFVGLPIPPAAGFLATVVLLAHGGLEIKKIPAVLIVAAMYALALFMVSNIPYRSFKQVDLARRKPFHIFLAVVLTTFVVVQFPHYMLFAMAMAYALSGPVEFGLELRGKPFRDKLMTLAGIQKPGV